MALYAALVAIVFSFVSPAETKRARILAGLRVFGEFLGVGLLLAWVVYFLPW
jgi:hypothetical protein